MKSSTTSTPWNDLVTKLMYRHPFRINSLDMKPRGKGNKAARRLAKMPSFLVYQRALDLGYGWPTKQIYMNAAFLLFCDMAQQNGVILKTYQRDIVKGLMRFNRQL